MTVEARGRPGWAEGALAAWTSPDGALTLVLYPEGEDSILGFTDYPWHTHGGFLVSEGAPSPAQGVGRLVEHVLTNQIPLMLVYRHGELVDVMIEEAPEPEEGELTGAFAIRHRYWSR